MRPNRPSGVPGSLRYLMSGSSGRVHSSDRREHDAVDHDGETNERMKLGGPEEVVANPFDAVDRGVREHQRPESGRQTVDGEERPGKAEDGKDHEVHDGGHPNTLALMTLHAR